MTRVLAAFFAIIIVSTYAMGQTIGLKIGTLLDVGHISFQSERLEASFAYPVLHNVEISVTSGIYTSLLRGYTNGYAVPILGEYGTPIHRGSIYAPYLSLEYGDVLAVRKRNHSLSNSTLKFGMGIQYPLRENMLLDVSTKLETADYFGVELMAGIRIPI